jgi:hypothetical protein
MIMSRILDFQINPVEYLELDELKLSVDECNTGNTPCNGITHYNLWCEIANLLMQRNIRFKVEPIAATDSKNRVMPGVSIIPAMEDKYGKGSIQSHLLRRVIGKITLPEYADEEHGSGLAINFHQTGIDIAYGMNVWVCGNLSIYGDTFIRSYGKDSVPLKKMYEIISDWLYQMDAFRNTDVSVVGQMKQQLLDHTVAIPSLVGKLAMQAVRAAYLDSRVVAPLNIGQVSTFTKNLLTDHGNELQEDVSVWHLMNLATDIIKPGKMNAQDILHQSHAIGRFFTGEYMPEEMKRQLEQVY